ncbi:MAG TPA: cyclic nucleotide-binding domain-containing protein [Puia sp.]|nr:cyclic nucleotide-binding domain-containing protein [Puia sp.]
MEYPLSQLQLHHPLSGEFIHTLGTMIRRLEPAKNNTLLVKGDICNDLYLIETGLLACFDTEKNKKYCTWLMTSGDFVTAVDSFNNQRPSTETIIAQTDSVLWAITRQQLEELTARFPEFGVIRQKLTDKYHIQSRVMDAKRKRPPEQFYQYLRENYPYIVDNAPASALASLMGITRTTYYKIVKKQRRKR